MWRSWCAILILPATLGFGQAGPTRVTFTTRAARTARVLKELSVVAQTDLQTIPEMENEVLVIAVRDVPLVDLMTRIATATSGKWKQQGTTYRLVPDVQKRKIEARGEAALRIANVQKSIAEFADQAAKQQAALSSTHTVQSGTESERVQKAAELAGTKLDTADYVIVTRLLSEIPALELAQMSPGDRVVYSSNPTRMQRPLSVTAERALDRYIQNRNRIIDSLPKGVFDKKDKSDEDAEAYRTTFKRLEGASKANFAVTKPRYPDNSEAYSQTANKLVDAELTICDSKGESLYSTRGEQLSGSDSDSSDTVSSQSASKAAGQISGTPIEYGADSRSLIQTRKLKTWWHYSPPFDADLRRKLFHPDEFDPLSFMQTDELLALAKAKGKPVVADLPDDFGTGPSPEHSDPNTLESVEKQLKDGGSIVSLPDDSFIVIRSVCPDEARNRRLDRQALTRLLGAAATKLVPSLDDFAEYALRAPSPLEDPAGAMYLMWFVPGLLTNITEPNSWEMLRFYGRLSPSNHAKLGGTGRLAFRELDLAARATLERITYSDGSVLTTKDSAAAANVQIPDPDVTLSDSPGPDLYLEPTEILPNGLPEDGFVEFKLTKGPLAFAVTDSYARYILGPEYGIEAMTSLSTLRSKNSPKLAGMDASIPSFRLGEINLLDFTFHMTPKYVIFQSIDGYSIASDSSTVSEADLTSRFQREIAARLAALQRVRAENQRQSKDIHPEPSGCYRANAAINLTYMAW